MSRLKELECKNCHMMFMPSKHNKYKQKYCTKKECRRTSHNKSQAKQRRKGCNQTLEKRIKNSEDTKDWQRRNPNYWKKPQEKRKKSRTKSLKSGSVQVLNSDFKKALLSDFVLTNTVRNHSLIITQLFGILDYQKYVINGLISHLDGSLLSDLIEARINVFYDIGKNISGMSSGMVSGKINKTQRKTDHEKQSSDQSG